MIDRLLKALLSEKGRDSNRALLLAGIVWIGVQSHDIQKDLHRLESRVAVIESKLSGRPAASEGHASDSGDQPDPVSFLSFGPQWPRDAVAAFR